MEQLKHAQVTKEFIRLLYQEVLSIQDSFEEKKTSPITAPLDDYTFERDINRETTKEYLLSSRIQVRAANDTCQRQVSLHIRQTQT